MLTNYVGKTANWDKFQGNVPLIFLQVCQFSNLNIVIFTLTLTPFCVNNLGRYKLFTSPKMSFLMHEKISMKFWQMSKNFLATIFLGQKNILHQMVDLSVITHIEFDMSLGMLWLLSSPKCRVINNSCYFVDASERH